MSKFSIGLLIAVVAVGNTTTSILVWSLRDKLAADSAMSAVQVGAAVAALGESVQSLREDVARLSASVASGAASPIASTDSTSIEGPGIASKFDTVLEKLRALEKSISVNDETSDTLAALRVREKLKEQFRTEEGPAIAEELLAQRKFAVGANGILTFLEANPDHPDEQDLMRRARDGFRDSGYLDKALWLQAEIMKKFPEHRGTDLYLIARLERRMKKFDEALSHISESADLAVTDDERLSRLFYRADIVHLRDGDAAGLAAYREVERLAKAAGTAHAGEARKRAARIEERLASR